MAERSSRWITVREVFDYRWDSGAITHFSAGDLGEHLVKDELADFAVDNGYATEGKVDGSARSKKGGKKRVRRARKAVAPKETAPATTANVGTAEGLGDTDPAGADRSADRPGVDSDAG